MGNMAPQANHPPTLGFFPLTKHLLEMGLADKDIFGLLHSLREKGDLTYLKLGKEDFYLFCNPDHVQYILHDKHHNFPKATEKFTPRNVRAFKSVMGNGLITSSGMTWKAQKKRVSPYFLGKVIQTYNAALQYTLTRTLQELEEKAKTGDSFDIEPIMRKVAFTMIGFIIFGEDLDKECDNMREAVEAYVHQYPLRISPLHLPAWFPTSFNKDYNNAKRYFTETIGRFYRERKASNKYPQDLLSMMMQTTDEETGKPIPFEQIRDELTTIILAGHETTASALSWTIALLAQHPEWEERLFNESNFTGRIPSHTDLDNFSDTKLVIEETLRMYPPVWGTGRTCKSGEVIDGYEIKKDSNIIVNFYFLHRHPDFWERPNEFDPMRFHNSNTRNRHEYAYLPFSAGPHTCIGRQLAMFEMLATIPAILKLFKIRLEPKAKIVPECFVGLRPKYGVHVRLEPREHRTKKPRYPDVVHAAPSSGSQAIVAKMSD